MAGAVNLSGDKLSSGAMPAALYVDLGSPYAYLALERAPALLGAEPELRPVLLGAIFARRGRGSWSATPERTARITDLEDRAARAGLPPFAWPAGWPADGLAAMRALTWAVAEGRGTAFARRVFRLQFAGGADIADVGVLETAADEAGLDPGAVRSAIADPAVKQRLREATDAAWDAGVRGIPTLARGGALFYGDDRLEEAAA
jgi:2-hydroxychromene-2-carboxylate isomerase